MAWVAHDPVVMAAFRAALVAETAQHEGRWPECCPLEDDRRLPVRRALCAAYAAACHDKVACTSLTSAQSTTTHQCARSISTLTAHSHAHGVRLAAYCMLLAACCLQPLAAGLFDGRMALVFGLPAHLLGLRKGGAAAQDWTATPEAYACFETWALSVCQAGGTADATGVAGVGLYLSNHAERARAEADGCHTPPGKHDGMSGGVRDEVGGPLAALCV
jgi:hypothetical protein